MSHKWQKLAQNEWQFNGIESYFIDLLGKQILLFYRRYLAKNGHFGGPRHIYKDYKDASNFDAGDTHFDRLIIMGFLL